MAAPGSDYQFPGRLLVDDSDGDQFTVGSGAAATTSPVWAKQPGELARYVSAAPVDSVGTVWFKVIEPFTQDRYHLRYLVQAGLPADVGKHVGIALYRDGTGPGAPGTKLGEWYGALSFDESPPWLIDIQPVFAGTVFSLVMESYGDATASTVSLNAEFLALRPTEHAVVTRTGSKSVHVELTSVDNISGPQMDVLYTWDLFGAPTTHSSVPVDTDSGDHVYTGAVPATLTVQANDLAPDRSALQAPGLGVTLPIPAWQPPLNFATLTQTRARGKLITPLHIPKPGPAIDGLFPPPVSLAADWHRVPDGGEYAGSWMRLYRATTIRALTQDVDYWQRPTSFLVNRLDGTGMYLEIDLYVGPPGDPTHDGYGFGDGVTQPWEHTDRYNMYVATYPNGDIVGPVSIDGDHPIGRDVWLVCQQWPLGSPDDPVLNWDPRTDMGEWVTGYYGPPAAFPWDLAAMTEIPLPVPADLWGP